MCEVEGVICEQQNLPQFDSTRADSDDGQSDCSSNSCRRNNSSMHVPSKGGGNVESEDVFGEKISHKNTSSYVDAVVDRGIRDCV